VNRAWVVCSNPVPGFSLGNLYRVLCVQDGVFEALDDNDQPARLNFATLQANFRVMPSKQPVPALGQDPSTVAPAEVATPAVATKQIVNPFETTLDFNYAPLH